MIRNGFEAYQILLKVSWAYLTKYVLYIFHKSVMISKSNLLKCLIKELTVPMIDWNRFHIHQNHATIVNIWQMIRFVKSLMYIVLS